MANESPHDMAVTAYFSYRMVLAEIEEQWIADSKAFGSQECVKLAKELERRSVELRAQARDWKIRASETLSS